MNSESLSFTMDPTWPWSVPTIGLPALAVVALLLVALTVWTYLGTARAGWRRLALMIALRLGALALACIAVVRPSLASRDSLKVPSILLILVDDSESMTIQDEFHGTRWDTVRRTLSKCDPVLKE